ncbi:MAG: hypothetical protein WC539_09650 [Nitrospirota bacterium]
MHDNHKHHHSHTHQHTHQSADTLRELQTILEHEVDHNDDHQEQFKAWAAKAHEAGEEEIAKEIYLAVQDNETVKNHLKRAKAILAAKLVLMK